MLASWIYQQAQASKPQSPADIALSRRETRLSRLEERGLRSLPDMEAL